MGELMQFAKGVWTPAALSHAISPNALSRESKGEEGTVTQEAVEEEAEEEDATGGEEEDAMGGDEDDEAMVVVEEEVVVVLVAAAIPRRAGRAGTPRTRRGSSARAVTT
jgi:hypothetical protein